ncbi:hypothetical protein HDF15_001012 [Granulicella mallensis]|uniref:Uncharacterized protein n=1 Tax=Granulicella mallensis TaxID=940614 RepID=A0A7W7ZN57_9BACT|nr:hypothetical protein [Granulicella mallensis]
MYATRFILDQAHEGKGRLRPTTQRMSRPTKSLAGFVSIMDRAPQNDCGWGAVRRNRTDKDSIIEFSRRTDNEYRMDGKFIVSSLQI